MNISRLCDRDRRVGLRAFCGRASMLLLSVVLCLSMTAGCGVTRRFSAAPPQAVPPGMARVCVRRRCEFYLWTRDVVVIDAGENVDRNAKAAVNARNDLGCLVMERSYPVIGLQRGDIVGLDWYLPSRGGEFVWTRGAGPGAARELVVRRFEPHEWSKGYSMKPAQVIGVLGPGGTLRGIGRPAF